MKSIIKLLIFSLFFICLSVQIKAQVKTKTFYKGIPAEMIMNRDSITAEKNIVAPQNFLDLLKKRNNQSDNAKEYFYQFALPVDVDIDILKEAKVIKSHDFITYAIKINAENALNISLSFSEFHLPKNSMLKIYTSNELTDSITAKENTKNGIWNSRVYQGSKVTIVLRVPFTDEEKSVLKISKINFGYRDFGGEFFGSPGASAACNINILCPEGNGWQNERNSVALIVVDGKTACTGALVMNTCGTNIPYFLTANHCVEGKTVTNWVFQFQYWSATCTPNTGWNEDIQFNGSTLRASNAESDFALLQLNQTPPINSGIQYAGWNRGFQGSAGTCIHHPMGDLMKISTKDFDFRHPIEPVQWLGSLNSSHWRVIFDHGIVQHGSSGAPLFDNNHRIIGQLHGNQFNICYDGDNNCFCNTINPQFQVTNGRIGEFGRFDFSWTGGGTNATRLSNWLDPSNSGATTTNTTNVSALYQSASAMSISEPAFLCSSAFYTLQGVPAGTPITWSVSNPNSATVTSSGYVTAIWAAGSFTLTATTHDNCGNPTNVDKTVSIGAPNISSYKVIGPGTVYSNAGYYYSVSSIGVPHPVNIYWSVPSGWAITNGQGTESISVWTGSAGGIVAIDFDNFCGEPTGTYKTVVIGTGGGVPQFTGDGINTLKITPNPANSNVTVSLVTNTTKMNNGSNSVITEIKIIDKMGTVRKRFTFNNRSASQLIDISGLRVDTYVIQAFTGTQWLSAKLLIVNN